MTEPIKPISKMPQRLSQKPIEEVKPSKIIAAFWWIVFIVPLVFTWVAFQSVYLIAAIVGIRVVIMFIPKFWKKKDTKKPEPKKEVVVQTINTEQNLLKPYKEEAIAEWRWLMKTLRIYDYDSAEEKYLREYRRLRGWE